MVKRLLAYITLFMISFAITACGGEIGTKLEQATAYANYNTAQVAAYANDNTTNEIASEYDILDEYFDFSEHMWIDDRFVELIEMDLSDVEFFDDTITVDWSRWEWTIQTGLSDVDLGIRLRGFSDGDEITVNENRPRIDGSFWWHPMICFIPGVRLNGEVIPKGCPFLYVRLKGCDSIGHCHDQLGISSFFVVPDLVEGKNVLEFTMFYTDYYGHFYSGPFHVEGISHKTIYIYYEP